MKVGKRYYWRTKAGARSIFTSGLLICISLDKVAILQDNAGLTWAVPIKDLFQKCFRTTFVNVTK